MSTDGLDNEQWKKKYYDQIDRLEQKEQDWEKLETTLKRTIGRLSLAAEGQDKALDRHIDELRTAIKNSINRQRLEVVVDDISRVLTQLEDNAPAKNRLAINLLEKLVLQLKLPASCNKQHKKLIKQFSKSDDEQRESLLNDTISLLKTAIVLESSAATESSGFLNRLFNSDKSGQKNISEAHDSATNIQSISALLEQMLSLLPWPEAIYTKSLTAINAIKQSTSDIELTARLKDVETQIKLWPTSSVQSSIESTEPSQLNTYKTCLINLLNNLDEPNSPSGQLTAFKITARDAKQESELVDLSIQLSRLLKDQLSTTEDKPSTPIDLSPAELPERDGPVQPSIQELLIRLLEQLIVPPDLQNDVDQMKQHLEKDNEPANWKSLLKDVALLINSIRSRMQQEKHEFETFLQQVTDRLKTMDQFLQIETDSLKTAHSKGAEFDKTIDSNVKEIRLDVDQATELSSLKNNVNSKLDTISSHIVHYREYEVHRVEESQQQVYDMQTRMLSLEKEAESLKQIVIEKNKQAMFDALTTIPNRLSYEKRIADEVSRWKRFNTPLSLAIWDIDFFKKVNDTYGHKAGDKVLKTVAQLLNKRIRATDFLARYGGEEFVMLLPGTKQEETLRLVNDLREQVESCGFHYHGEAVKITVSCGVSSFNKNDTVEKVFERADQALYKAKENGRNQCVVAACLSD